MSLPAVRLTLLCCVVAVLAGASQAVAATRTGTLEAVHGHRVDDWGSTHTLRLGNHVLDARAIGGADRFAQRLGGRKVKAVGSLSRRGVLRLRSLRAVGPSPARAAHVLTGQKSVLVVPFHVTGGPAATKTKATIHAAIFGATGSLSAYLAEQTSGNVTLTGETMDEVEVTPTPGRGPATSCDDMVWLDRVDDAIVNSGRSLNHYDRIVYVSSDLPQCDYAGQAPVSNLPMLRSWLHLNDDVSVRIAAHEWGHTYGLMHAASTRCTAGGANVPLSSSCTDTEYGDPFDPMGTTPANAPRWFQGFNRTELGLLGNAATRTALTSGQYVIGALAQSTTGPRVLKVPRPDGSFLGLELRRTNGSFESFASPDHDGLTVRVLPGPGSVLTRALTRLVDAHPATATFNDAPLRATETLTDPLSGAVVSVVSTEADRATVDVLLPGAVAPPLPEVPATPSTTTPTAATPAPVVTPPAVPPVLPPAATPPAVRPPAPAALAVKVLRRKARSLQVRVTPGCACRVAVSLLKGKKLLVKRTRTGDGVVVLTASRSVKGTTLVVKQGKRTLRKKV